MESFAAAMFGSGVASGLGALRQLADHRQFVQALAALVPHIIRVRSSPEHETPDVLAEVIRSSATAVFVQQALAVESQSPGIIASLLNILASTPPVLQQALSTCGVTEVDSCADAMVGVLSLAAAHPRVVLTLLSWLHHEPTRVALAREAPYLVRMWQAAPLPPGSTELSLSDLSAFVSAWRENFPEMPQVLARLSHFVLSVMQRPNNQAAALELCSEFGIEPSIARWVLTKHDPSGIFSKPELWEIVLDPQNLALLCAGRRSALTQLLLSPRVLWLAQSDFANTPFRFLHRALAALLPVALPALAIVYIVRVHGAQILAYLAPARERVAHYHSVAWMKLRAAKTAVADCHSAASMKLRAAKTAVADSVKRLHAATLLFVANSRAAVHNSVQRARATVAARVTAVVEQVTQRVHAVVAWAHATRASIGATAMMCREALIRPLQSRL